MPGWDGADENHVAKPSWTPTTGNQNENVDADTPPTAHLVNKKVTIEKMGQVKHQRRLWSQSKANNEKNQNMNLFAGGMMGQQGNNNKQNSWNTKETPQQQWKGNVKNINNHNNNSTNIDSKGWTMMYNNSKKNKNMGNWKIGHSTKRKRTESATKGKGNMPCPIRSAKGKGKGKKRNNGNVLFNKRETDASDSTFLGVRRIGTSSSSSKKGDKKNCDLAIEYFFVIDNVSGERLTPIESTETLDLTLLQESFDISLDNLAVECSVDGTPSKVGLADSRGTRTLQSEAPYALQLVPGNTFITCEAFCEREKLSVSQDITFTAVEAPTAPTAPTVQPSENAVAQPTFMPAPVRPTARPTLSPLKPHTLSPTSVPTTAAMTNSPTGQPTAVPTSVPTAVPSTSTPTVFPSSTPTFTMAPTEAPSSFPTRDCDGFCALGCVEVVQFNLFDTSTNTRVRPLRQDGDTVEVNREDLWSIECVGNPRGKVGSIVMRDDRETLDGVVEGFAPYTLNRNREDSNFFENPGLWTVWCEPYCGNNAEGGPSGAEVNITFTVVPIVDGI
eukprot:scaffold24543_cov195-Amphora_coffeaeformis.AAC.5